MISTTSHGTSQLLLCTEAWLTNFLSAVKVVSVGLEMSIQDLPGRMIGKGIPRSGPMDPIAFSIGNLLVGNQREIEGLEIVVVSGLPACFRFLSSADVAITGREVTVSLNEVKVNMWTRLFVPPETTLKITASSRGDNGGLRVYLLVGGGFPKIPPYLESKSTSVGIGGYQVCCIS